MGDRANVKIVDGESTVYLYTHWTGTDLPKLLQDALNRGEDRLQDGSYLARIIFSEMTRGNEDGLTGFGISSVIGDGEDRVITIDVGAQTAQVQDDRVFPLRNYLTWKNPRWIMDERRNAYCPHCGRK